MPHTLRITEADTSWQTAANAVNSAPEGYVVTFERKFILANDNVRARVIGLIKRLKKGWAVKVQKRNRSSEQNALFWVLLTELSKTKPQGRIHTPEVWKCLIMNARDYETSFEIGLDDKPFPVGFRSSHLTVQQMTELIEFTYAWGAQNGVEWSEPPAPEYQRGEAA